MNASPVGVSKNIQIFSDTVMANEGSPVGRPNLAGDMGVMITDGIKEWT